MLALPLVLSARWTTPPPWLAPVRAPAHTRGSVVRCDLDRCYYGAIDADGHVVEKCADVERGKVFAPRPSLTPLEVVDAQLRALSRGMQGLDDAFAFVSPRVIEQYDLNREKFKGILQGFAFEGLLGCVSWKVTGERMPSEDKCVVSLTVLPKPIPGCVKSSGVADQGGITWPANYAWHLACETAGPLNGCWMLEQMSPDRPPVDIDSMQSTPQISPVQTRE